MNNKLIIKAFCVIWLLLASAVPAQTFGQQKNWSAKQIEAANKAVTVYMKHDTRESKHLAAVAISEILGISMPDAYKYIDNRVSATFMSIIDREERAKERFQEYYRKACDTCAGYIRKLYEGKLLTQDEIEAFPRFQNLVDLASKHFLGKAGASVKPLTEAATPVMRDHTIKFGDGSGRWVYNTTWSPTITLVGSTVLRYPQSNKTDTVFQFIVQNSDSHCILWHKSTGAIRDYWAVKTDMNYGYIKGDFRGFLPETVARYREDSLYLRNNLEQIVNKHVKALYDRERSMKKWELRGYDLSRVIKKKAKPLPSYLMPKNLYYVGKDGKYDIWTFAYSLPRGDSYNTSISGRTFSDESSRRPGADVSSGEAHLSINNPVHRFKEILSSVHSPDDINSVFQQSSMNEAAEFLLPFIRNNYFFDMRDFFVESIPRILSQSLLYRSYLCYKERNVQNTPHKPSHHGLSSAQAEQLYLFLVVDKQNQQIYLVDGLKQQKVEITPSLRFLLQ